MERGKEEMKKRRRILSLFSAACLAITGIVSGAGVQKAEAAARTEVIDVTDYGVYPDSGKDSAIGIQKAIAAAKDATKEGKEVKINFPEGRYDIYPDKAIERELYVSNTVGADQNNKMKKIGIFLEDMDHVTVDGNNSLFMFHGKMTTFATIGCEDVEFKNFAVDFQVPTVIDMTVESVEGNTATVYIPECYNYEVSGSTIKWYSDVSPYTGQRYWSISDLSGYHTQREDTVQGIKFGAGNGNAALRGVASIEDLGNHRVKITYNSKAGEVQNGMCFQSRPTVRDHAGTFFWKSKDIKMTSLDIQFLHGFGMVGQHSENITMEDVDFEAPKESGRTTAGYADFVQMSGCKGAININNCTFAGPHDDPINIHGTFNTVTSISSDRRTITVQYNHRETAGFPNFFEGDEIEFMTKGNMITVENSVRTVTKVDGPDGMGGNMGEGSGSLTTIKLTLDKAIPADVQVNQHVVENITYTPAVNISNCEFKEVPTRGILVTTRKPIVIENNTFDGMSMAGIYISDDAQGWYESGPVRDVTIRNNTFTRGNAQAIFIEPTNPTVSTEKTVHSNIKIENNTFFMYNKRVLDAKSVKDLTFKNNKIYRQDPINGDGSLSLAVKDGSSTELNVADSAELTVSGSGNTLSGKLYNFNGCKNVVIEGNEYDGGMNAGSSISNMSASDITVTNDAMKVNADSTTAANGTVYYESDNEKVVKVSSTGVVTAAGAGTANVTGYMVVGGRKFPTNAVTFTVSGSDLGNLPSGIELTAADNKENIKVNDTIQYTASLKWNDGETGTEQTNAVTWKVYDAKTGAETDKATITTEGLLTAAKPGSVVVTASTVNGYAASKLVSIWQDGKVIASDITVDHPTSSDKYRASSTVEGGLEQDFTSQGLYQNQTPSNVLVKALPEGTDRTSLTLIFKLTGATPANTWADAGIYLYDDADNYVALEKKHRDGSTSAVALVKEQNRSAVEVPYNNWANVSTNPIWLKLVKEDSTVTAYFSADKSTWTTIGSRTDCGFLSDNFKLAIASQGTTSGSITYSDVTVNDKEVKLVEDAVKATASNVEVTYDEDANSLTAAGDTTGQDVIVKWAAADEEDGNYSIISGAEGTSLTASKAMKGKYVKAAYVPLIGTGAAGDIVWSDAVKVTGNGTDSGASAVKSANADLATADIKTSESTDMFQFVKGIIFYQTTAGSDVQEIKYSFAAEDTKATVKVLVNGKETAELSGNAVLTSGRNLIEVNVTAEDGVTMKKYRFTISRQGDNNALLESLQVNGQEVVLEGGVYEYSLPIATGTTTAQVAATAQSTRATVSIVNGKEVTSAAQTVQGDVTVAPGINEITIRVTPETSAEPVYYKLKLKVPNAANARLEALSLGGNISLKENFDADTLKYTASATESAVTINATAEEADATVEVIWKDKVIQTGTGSASAELGLTEGDNTVKVKVTSADKSTEKTYKVTVHASGDTWLSDLDWTSQTSGDSGNPTRKDKSCGNNTLTLWDGSKEETFDKGIGSHADSTIIYDLTGKGYTSFSSYYGVDRETKINPSQASITFKVYVDGNLKFTSDVMGTNTAKGFTGDIDITDATELKLVMDKGANNWSDHGDWANAKLTKPFTAPQPVVVTVQVNDPVMGSAATDKGEYQKYDTATVTATAKEGYHFVNWTNAEGTEVSDANPHVFDVTEDVTLTANFAANPVVKKQYTVTATASAEAMGTVSMDHEDGIYEDGEKATVTATAKEGHHFVGWKLKDAEDILSTDAKYTFVIKENVDLIGVFEKDEEPAKKYTLTTEVNDKAMGSVTVTPAQTEYEENASVTVKAAPASEAYEFVNWINPDTDKEVSKEAEYTFQITGDMKLKANFRPVPVVKEQYHVTVTSNDETMGIVSMDHEDGIYEDGADVTVTATAAEGHHFIGWKLKGSEDVLSKDAKHTFVIKENVDLIGVFEKDEEPAKKYTLTTEVNDKAMGSVTVTPAQTEYEENASVTVKAAPASEAYEFVNWINPDTDKEVSKEAEYTFQITGDMKLKANFRPVPVVKEQYHVTVTSNDETMGIVSMDHEDGIYEDGADVTVTATAAEGHHFVGWKLKDSEDILSTDAKYTFKIEKDVDLIGEFEKDAEPEQVITAEEIMRRIIADKSFATSIKKDTKKLVLPEVPENAQIEICSVNPEGIIALNGEVTIPQEDTEVIVTVKVTGTDGSVATKEFKVMVEGNGETEKPAPEKPDNGNVNQSGAKDNNANSSTPNGGAGQNTVKAIKTGDTANFALYGIVMVAAGAVIATLVYRRKRS